MHPVVGLDPAWLSKLRGCFVISAESPALLSGLQLNGGHLGGFLVLKCQKSQELHMSPFGLRLVLKSLSLTLQLICVLLTLAGAGEGRTVTSLT